MCAQSGQIDLLTETEDGQLRSFHAHFLRVQFIKPAATFQGEILDTQDFLLCIPA